MSKADIILTVCDDIEKAMKSNSILSALALALTIPDTCGKVMFPKISTVRGRWIKWFDKYITSSMECSCESCKIKTNHSNYVKQNGDLFYKLRCSFLHSNETIDDKDNDESKNSFEFELRYSDDDYKSEFGIYLCDSYGWLDDNFKITINPFNLCQKLIMAAREFYEVEKGNQLWQNKQIKIERLNRSLPYPRLRNVVIQND